MTAFDRDEVARAWSLADARTAVLPADRDIIADSEAVRALIVDLVVGETTSDELFDACAVLGRLIARHQGSPTLAALTIDHACEALGAVAPGWLAPARAAVAEGFADALLDVSHTQARDAWEYPRCAVAIGNGAVAIATSYPSDDRELIDEWAARVARSVALDGFRGAVVAGHERGRRAMTEALAIVGVDVRSATR
jgi:hypothetical protein